MADTEYDEFRKKYPIPQLQRTETSSSIQWKGTDVCIDLKCPDCKGQCHYDGDFLYAWKCPYCGAEWEMPTEIEMLRKVEGHPCCQYPKADE